MIKKVIKKIKRLYKQTVLNPCPLMRTVYYNFLRYNTKRASSLSLLKATAYSVFDLHSSAKLNLAGESIFGFKKYRGSRVETSLWMDKGSSLEMDSNTIFHGCDFQIFKDAQVSIGKRTVFNRGAQIICQNKVTIGEGCLISRGVVIRDNDGGHKILVDGYKKDASVHIGNHVWIGHNAIILKGVKIGDGAIIGSGAIVATNVKAKALVMPDPARTFAKDIEWEA